MSGVVVKTEDFMNGAHNVRLVTYEDGSSEYCERCYTIVKDGKVTYLSPLFHGNKVDVVRSCDSALDVVRVLLKETGFLTGKVVGA